MKIFTVDIKVAVFILPLLLFTVKPTDAQLLRSFLRRLTRNTGTVHNDPVPQEPVQQDIQLQNPDDPEAVREEMAPEQDSVQRTFFVDGSSLDFVYWNSYLGNSEPVVIEFGNEKQMINYWIPDKPLKVITHGWLGSDEDDAGVFAIKTAYVATGNFNVITADWNRVASNFMYPLPAYLTVQVGSVIAQLLENFVRLAVIDPSDIHVIGHSLGAHVSGACGAAFSLGKIGRVTGLDPAGPGFEYVALRSDRLDATDAEFVDVIHTAANTLGYSKPIGHADYYPNGGKNPQPGCFESFMPNAFATVYMGCSHSRAHELFADSVYHRNSFLAVECPSWDEFLEGVCQNNTKSLMGHDADPKSRGIFYLKTNSISPYAILDNTL